MKNIKSILEDVYKIDPSLRENEREIIALLEALIEVKPDITPNKNFVRQLRSQLSQKASAKAEDADTKTSRTNWLQSLLYALGGGALTGVLALVIVMGMPNSGSPIFSRQMTELAKGAFELVDLAPIDGSSAISARPQSGGGGVESLDAKIDSRMIMPINPIKVEYAFEGQFPFPEENELPIYKLQTGEVNDGQLANVIKELDFSLADLSAIQSAKVQNISIAEDRKNGYIFYIDLQNGNISINQNWQRWDNPYDQCAGDESCLQNLRIKASDIPEDGQLISAADAFVKKYGIDLSGYGTPEVNRTWERYIANAEKPEDVYYPEQITVVYPELLDGKFIMEGPESKAGISITIDVRSNLVANAWGLKAVTYSRSLYEAEKDEAVLNSWVKKGGWQNYYYGEEQKVVTAQVENPQLVYMKVYQYKDGSASELLVPAYLMQVAATDVEPNSFYYRSEILVPAIKGIDDLRGDTPIIMPLEDGAAVRPMIKTDGQN